MNISVGLRHVEIVKIAVSAYGDDNYRGAVYVFDTDGSNQVKVTASDRTSSDYFGLSIGIGSSKLAVGAPYDDDNGSASGSVYVYNLDGTGEVKLLHLMEVIMISLVVQSLSEAIELSLVVNMMILLEIRLVKFTFIT